MTATTTAYNSWRIYRKVLILLNPDSAKVLMSGVPRTYIQAMYAKEMEIPAIVQRVRKTLDDVLDQCWEESKQGDPQACEEIAEILKGDYTNRDKYPTVINLKRFLNMEFVSDQHEKDKMWLNAEIKKRIVEAQQLSIAVTKVLLESPELKDYTGTHPFIVQNQSNVTSNKGLFNSVYFEFYQTVSISIVLARLLPDSVEGLWDRYINAYKRMSNDLTI